MPIRRRIFGIHPHCPIAKKSILYRTQSEIPSAKLSPTFLVIFQ